MENNQLSYTNQLVKAMMDAYLASKEAHGMTLNNKGLVEDCVGNLLAFGIEQSTMTLNQGTEDEITVYNVNVTLKRANVANF